MVDTNNRYLMALYYAHGRVDEADRLTYAILGDAHRNPLEFAEWYLAQCEEFANGKSSYLRSVQESWTLWKGINW